VYVCALETWANLKDTDAQQPIQEAQKKIRNSAKLFATWVGFIGAKALL